MGNYKLNVGFCKDSRNMNVGLGFVIRDCNGFVAAAMTQQMAWHDDKVQIHAMMVLKALKFSYMWAFADLKLIWFARIFSQC